MEEIFIFDTKTVNEFLFEDFSGYFDGFFHFKDLFVLETSLNFEVARDLTRRSANAVGISTRENQLEVKLCYQQLLQYAVFVVYELVDVL